MRIHINPDPAAAADARALIVDDDHLSFAARGLLLHILGHAPEWDMNANGLAEAARQLRGSRGEGKSVTRGLLKELEQSRYLIRTVGGGAGRHVGTRLDVYDTQQPGIPLIPVDPLPVAPGARRGSVVYLIGEAGSRVGKVGTTTHIGKRLVGIQSGCPVILKVRWSAPGSGRTELLLHNRLDRYRMHGEWFDFGRADPVKTVQREYDKISNADYVEIERQLAEYGAVIDYTNLSVS